MSPFGPFVQEQVKAEAAISDGKMELLECR